MEVIQALQSSIVILTRLKEFLFVEKQILSKMALVLSPLSVLTMGAEVKIVQELRSLHNWFHSHQFMRKATQVVELVATILNPLLISRSHLTMTAVAN